MLTKNDIALLKEVFPTKEDFRLQEIRLHKKLDNYATKKDLNKLRGELKNYATKEDLSNTTDQLISLTTDGFTTIIEKLDNALHELKTNRIVLGSHEERLQKVEGKVFSQT